MKYIPHVRHCVAAKCQEIHFDSPSLIHAQLLQCVLFYVVCVSKPHGLQRLPQLVLIQTLITINVCGRECLAQVLLIPFGFCVKLLLPILAQLHELLLVKASDAGTLN
jgi:hypothetical protein